jgi:hypothetical protein
LATHTTLKGLSRVGDSLLSDQLEANLLTFVSWGLLGAGGFTNVTIPASGCYGGDFSRLRLVDDPNYSPGQVWEGVRKDWVWETGVECPDGQPIRVSGAFVDGAFVPVGTGMYVDYPNGRLVFAEPRAASGVRCEHSYRLVQGYTADCDWWQQLQFDSFRADDPQFLQQGSGSWDVLAQSRVQMPAVVVEAVPNARRVGTQMGGLTQTTRQDVLFHVLAEDRWHEKFLHDALSAQKEKTVHGFDKNLLFAADAFPLTPEGSPRPSGLMYPDLVRPTGEGGFFWTKIRIGDTSGTPQPRLGPLRYCTVRLSAVVDVP